MKSILATDWKTVARAYIDEVRLPLDLSVIEKTPQPKIIIKGNAAANPLLWKYQVLMDKVEPSLEIKDKDDELMRGVYGGGISVALNEGKVFPALVNWNFSACSKLIASEELRYYVRLMKNVRSRLPQGGTKLLASDPKSLDPKRFEKWVKLFIPESVGKQAVGCDGVALDAYRFWGMWEITKSQTEKRAEPLDDDIFEASFR